jgi:hypothetical protein
MRREALLTVVLLVLGGGAAGVLSTQARRPEPRGDELRLHETPFQLERKGNDPFVVRPEKWQPLPAMRGDFDLYADIELAEGASFDLLLRRMEPHQVQGTAVPFHGRFAALRLSTEAEGPPWRLPAEALLGPAGGVRLAPGLTASLKIEARGRTLTANVAGKVLPPFSAMDEIGSLALIARGAPAAFTRLEIQAVPAPRRIPLAAVGAAIGAALAALALRLGASRSRRLLAAGLLALQPLFWVPLVFGVLPPLAQPDPRDEVLLLCGTSALAVLCLLPKRRFLLALVLCVLAAATAVLGVQQRNAARFPDPGPLDALFGPAAGTEVVESLAQCVRGPVGLHVPDPKKSFVFLLGGQLLWQRSEQPGQAPLHIEPLLEQELKSQVSTVEVASLPTMDGWSRQQWQLFATCFAGYQPKVLVFGVPKDEAAVDPHTRAPRSSPAALTEVIQQAAEHAKARSAKLILFSEAGIEPNLYAALLRQRERGITWVEAPAGASAAEIAMLLGNAITPLLR